MSPLVRGVMVTIALLLGGLALTGAVGVVLEKRAERPVDQAFSPTAN
jgi:hypothetical protein